MGTKSNAAQLAMKHLRNKQQSKSAAPASSSTAGSLQERAMLIRFHVGRWYGTGADEEVVAGLKAQHNAKGDVGTFTKRFMHRDALAGIARVTNEARRYHKMMTLPWLDKLRILSSELFFDYKATMSTFEIQFMQEVAKFLKNFDAQKEAERKRLGGLFKERDYPSIEALQERFRWEVRVEPIPSADDFRVNLGTEEMTAIRKQIEEDLSGALREASRDLWQRMYDLVKALRDAMRDTDGAVRASLFENIKSAVALMPRLNIANDPRLATLTAKITADLLSEDVGNVRGDPMVKESVAKKADAILNSMQSFIGTMPADDE